MTTAKVTSKGQITIPKRVREQLGLKPGDEVEFLEEEAGIRIRKEMPESPFARYRGHLKRLSGTDPDELVASLRGE